MHERNVAFEPCGQYELQFPITDSAGNLSLPIAAGLPVVSRDVRIAHVEPPIIILIPAKQFAVARALNSRMLVLGLLLIAGPIGLPALWFSQRFSKPTKIVTTAAYMIATVVLPIAAVVYYMEVSLWPLVKAFRN